MVPAALALFGLGYAVQRYLINLVVNAPIFITLLLTFGLQLLVVNGLILGFTADYRSIPTAYAARSLVLPGDVRVPLGRLLAALVAVGLTIALGYLMRRTRTGMAILATGMDRGAARLMGIKARHVYALTFGIAAALAGAAGAAVAGVSTFSPADAGRFTLFSFVAAVLGGLGNTAGALLGGVVSRAGRGHRRAAAARHPGQRGRLRGAGGRAGDPAAGHRRPGLLRGPGGNVSERQRANRLAPSERQRALLPWAAGLLALVAGFVLQTRLYTGQERTVSTILMFVGLAAAWNLIGGYTGYASFGQVGFFGLGGYTTVVVMVHAHLSFWLALPVAAAVAGVFAAAVGWPLLRLRGHYFRRRHARGRRGTLREVVTNLPGITGGGAGITIPTVGPAAPTPWLGNDGFYVLFLLLAAGVVAVAALIATTPAGYALRAIHQDEEAAGAMGVNTTVAKTLAFAVSAALTGAIGAAYAFQQVTIFPERLFDVDITVLMVVMVVLGGSGTVAGPILGAVAVGAASEWLRQHFTVGHTAGTRRAHHPRRDPAAAGLHQLRARRRGLAPVLAAGERAEVPAVDRRCGAAGRDEPVAPLRWADRPRGCRPRPGAGPAAGRHRAQRRGQVPLINLLTGHVKPTTGRVLVDGRDLTGARPWRIAHAGVARTFQIVKPFRGMTVVDNVIVAVLFGGGRTGTLRRARPRPGSGSRRARQVALEVLDRVGLADRAAANPAELAVADAHRLELAKALALRPRVLLLDEVLAGLRPAEIGPALALIDGLRRDGLALLMVEHVVQAIAAVSDEVLVLHHGEVLTRGTPGEVLADERVIAAYLGARYAARSRASVPQPEVSHE